MWRSTLTAIEADVRFGTFLPMGQTKRVRAIVGGHARVLAILDGVPLPHFGIFAGLLFR